MTEDIVSINSPKWNYICGTKNQPWSQIEKEGTSKDLQYISLRMYRETKGLQPQPQPANPQEDFTKSIPKKTLH